MSGFYPITGFHDALQTAVDLGVFDDMGAVNGSLVAEYRRGAVELIAHAFIRGDDDPGTGDRLAYVERLGRRAAGT